MAERVRIDRKEYEVVRRTATSVVLRGEFGNESRWRLDTGERVGSRGCGKASWMNPRVGELDLVRLRSMPVSR